MSFSVRLTWGQCLKRLFVSRWTGCYCRQRTTCAVRLPPSGQRFFRPWEGEEKQWGKDDLHFTLFLAPGWGPVPHRLRQVDQCLVNVPEVGKLWNLGIHLLHSNLFEVARGQRHNHTSSKLDPILWSRAGLFLPFYRKKDSSTQFCAVGYIIHSIRKIMLRFFENWAYVIYVKYLPLCSSDASRCWYISHRQLPFQQTLNCRLKLT